MDFYSSKPLHVGKSHLSWYCTKNNVAPKIEGFGIQDYTYEIYTDGWYVAVPKAVVCEPKQNATFANPSISNDD